MSKNPFTQITPEQQFWRWFEKNEDMLFDFERDQDRIFDKLASQLNRVNPHLSFEFGPAKGGKRELVISASGIKDAFEATLALLRAAPSMERWQITAFRPRRWPLNTIYFKDKEVDPKNVRFTLLQKGSKVGIRLYIPGFVSQEIVWKEIAYLLLDEALGEFDVETKVGLIDVRTLEADSQFTQFPLEELPQHFDELTAGLDGTASPRPS